LSKIIKILV